MSAGSPDAVVAVVVPVRNGAATLPDLLDALEKQDLGEPFDVVIVDNGSTDATATVASAHRLRPLVISEPRPGAYLARNAGIAATSAPVVAFTDADCTPEPSWLSEGLAALRAGADLAGGDVRQELPSRPNSWERFDARHYLNQRRIVERSRFAATANLFVQRQVIDTVGPFDGALPSGGDLEFCYRAQHHGFSLVYASGAIVRHRPRSSMREMWKLHMRLERGRKLLAQRHPDVYAELHTHDQDAWSSGEPPAPFLTVVRRRAGSLAPFAVRSIARFVASRRSPLPPAI